jgi:CRP-like cAMP-binding protein
MEEKISHSLVQSLRRIPDFATLDERTLLQIVGESMNLFWKAGSTVFTPGSPGDALYLIISGEVSIYDTGSDGSKVVANPKAGDFFGEMSLLLNATHSKTAVALTDCEVLVLPKEAFESVLKSNPTLAAHFERVIRARHPRVEAEVSQQAVT